MKLSKPTIFLALLGWLATGQAEAASVISCVIGATPIPFGAYDPTNPSDVTPTGSISVTCSLISGLSIFVGYTITLSTGSGSYAARKMTGTATPMYYNLYINGAWTQIWGDGTGGTFTKTDGYLVAIGNTTLSYTVYSKLPARQLVAAGGYSDNVVISVNY